MMRFQGLSFSRGFSARADGIFADAQKRLDAAVIRKMQPYTPVADRKYRNAGKMRDSHRVQHPGIIINTEPKARREYYTNRGHGEDGVNSVHGASGLRGKYWFERMKADCKQDIRKEVWGK